MRFLLLGPLPLLVALSARAADPMAGGPATADVFVPKSDGFASVRIPSVVVTARGTVLAFAEGRAADADQAKNKIVLKRSTDGGKTWSKLAVIAVDGDKALNNPCAVVERAGGQVLVMYQSYPAGVSERSGKIRPGYDGDQGRASAGPAPENRSAPVRGSSPAAGSAAAGRRVAGAGPGGRTRPRSARRSVRARPPG